MNPKTILLLLIAILTPVMCLSQTGKADADNGIANTYWRNAATGDWLIGIAKDHIVVDSKVWDITGRSRRGDAYRYTISCNNNAERKQVKVGKLKKGFRLVTIGKGKPVKCDEITTEALPDYPVKDDRAFADNGYRLGDSVEISGWIKDRSPRNRARMLVFKVTCPNIFASDEYTRHAVIDSLGRFHLKMPLQNTSEAYFEWGPWYTKTILEPGKRYFYLQDFKPNKSLFMGDDVRVQNELEAYPVRSELRHADRSGTVSSMRFLQLTDSASRGEMDSLNAFIETHPNLSRRYSVFARGYHNVWKGFIMGQAQFVYNQFPKSYIDYVDQQVWRKVSTPYTLFRPFNYFIRDWYQILRRQRRGMLSADWTADAINLLAASGTITLSAGERGLLAVYKDKIVGRENAHLLQHTTGEKALPLMRSAASALRVAFENLLPVIAKTDEATFLKARDEAELRDLMQFVNAEVADSSMRNIIIARYLVSRMNEPLDSNMRAFADREVHLPMARCFLSKADDHAASLQTVDSADMANVNYAVLPDTVTDARTIISSIVRPYHGRPAIIGLLPVAGGNRLRHAFVDNEEDYARLKPFNPVFVMLGSSDFTSQETAWSKRLLGESLVTYKLTSEQMKSINSYLKTWGFPYYWISAPDGTLFNYFIDNADVDFLVTVLKEATTR